MPPQKKNKDKKHRVAPPDVWSEDVDQDIEDKMEESGQPIPSMAELLDEAEEIEELIKKKVPKADSTFEPEDYELKGLIDTAVITRSGKKEASKRMEVVDETSEETDQDKDQDAYQESFASQQEAAEIRGHIESLDTRMLNIESLIESVMKEREGMTHHLSNLRSDMNKQLTIMSDRLHTALEKDISTSAIAQSKEDVAIMTAESSHVLSQLETDIGNEPSQDSATSRTVPITTRRRKVRLIK
jgi:hypothetical protein